MNTDKNNTQLPQSSVKGRFFAQYFGQEVGLIPSYPNGDEFIKAKVSVIKEVQYLQLKSLSKITDEDVEELLPLVSFQFSSKYTDFEIKEEIKKSVLDTEMMPLNLTDYLRSKGYALSFMEYSVDDLISFGWVQLL